MWALEEIMKKKMGGLTKKGELFLEVLKESVKKEKNTINEKENKQPPKDPHLDIMLSYEKKPYKTMAIGEHNGHYYFGTILYYGNKKVPAVILDDGTIHYKWIEKTDEGIKVNDGITDDFGLRFRFELYDDVVDNLWSNKSINQFRKGNAMKINPLEMFNQIKSINKEFIYHSDERVHSFVACDIISNYFYPLFNAKGRTYFKADFGSGKSRQSLIYQKLSFNSLFAANISAAAFERVIESTGGTIIVDNFDNISDELKQQILQAIEVYYKKGGKKINADGKNHKPIAFNGYSPLVINNLVGLPEVTESRCNLIQMLKTNKKEIVDKKINEQDPRWNYLKDNLHLLALQNWKKIKEIYQNLNVPELNARDLERVEAVLTIAKFLGEDIYSQILAYIIEINEQQSIKEVSDNWEFMIFEFLNNFVSEHSKRIRTKDITEGIGYKIIQSDKTEKSDKLKFSHYIGKIFKGIPIFQKKIIDGWVTYEITREDLNKILFMKGYNKYLTIPHLTSLDITEHHSTPLNYINNNKNNDNNVVFDKEKKPIPSNFAFSGSHIESDVSDVQCGSKVKLENENLDKNNPTLINLSEEDKQIMEDFEL